MGNIMRKFNITTLFLLTFLCVFFLGCENSTPAIGAVSTAIIYDYAENSENPCMKMAVFVELNSDPIRIRSVTITSPDKNYSWNVEHPVYFNNKDIVLVGTSNMMSVQNVGFPVGMYSLEYTDVAKRSVKVFFDVPHIEPPKEQDFENNAKKMLALYDKNDNLLYYGDRVGFDSDSIRERFPDTKRMCEILVLNDDKTAIIESKTEL